MGPSRRVPILGRARLHAELLRSRSGADRRAASLPNAAVATRRQRLPHVNVLRTDDRHPLYSPAPSNLPPAPSYVTPGATWGTKPCSDVRISTSREREQRLTSNRRSCRALLAASAAIAAAAIAPGRRQRGRERHGHRRRREPDRARGHAEHPQHEPACSASRPAATDHWSAVRHRTRRRDGRQPDLSAAPATLSPQVGRLRRQRRLHSRRSRTTTRAAAPVADQHAEPAVHHHGVHCHRVAPHRAADPQARVVRDQHDPAADRPQPGRAVDRRVRGGQRAGQPGWVAAGHARRRCSPIRRRGPSACRSTRAPAST